MLRNEGSPAFPLFLVLLLAAAGTAGCGPDRAEPPAETAIRTGESPELRRGEFRQTFLLTGELEAVSGKGVMVPRTPTWEVQIRWILEDGSEVREGDEVIELDTTAILGDLEQKRIAEISAVNEIEQKEAEVEVKNSEHRLALEKAAAALEKAKLDAEIPEEIRSRRDHQEAQLALEKARVDHEKALENLKAHEVASRVELDNLQIQLQKARREIDTAEEAIRNMTLHAPGDGIFIVENNWREGRKWQTGDRAWVGLKLAEIPDLSVMRVFARLSDVDDGKIAPGLPAVCVLDAYPDILIAGKVTEIGSVAQEKSWRSSQRHFPVRIELERSDPEIMRPGMSARVEVETVLLEDALVAPRAALDLAGATPRLLMADGSEREVVLGPCNAFECVVDEGAPDRGRLRAQR